jgi:ABC-type branched-subunit amino acid transport system substrate-binding protein
MSKGAGVVKAEERQRAARRLTGRLCRGTVGATMLAGLLTAGGGILGGISGVGGAAASAASSSTCPAPTAATAAENASTTGVSAKSVTVGNVSIISGPVPGLFEGAPIGVKAYFNYINSKGGVNGRKLLVDSRDDAFSGQQNLTQTQDAVGGDFAMVGSFSLFDGYGCKALAADTAVPDVSVSLDTTTDALPNAFSVEPTSVGETLGPLQYYKKHYPKDTTIGTIVSNTASALVQWDGEKAALQHEGYKVAYVDDVSPLASDFTTDVIDMRNKGVNAVVLTALDWQDAAIFMQDAATQNWHPGLVFSGGPVYADQFISHAGGAAAVNGIQIGQLQALYLGQDASSVPAVKEFLSYVKKVDPSWTPDLYTLFGWASADLFVQALKAAGPHPTRGAVIAQLKKITSFNANGILAPSDPAGKKPSSCYLLAQIKDGKFVRVLPKKSGFECNSTYYYAPGNGS